jgi:hypothetical protein
MATADEIAAARKVLQQREAAEALARTKYEQLAEQLREIRLTGVGRENRVQVRELDAQTEQALQAYSDAQFETAAAQRQLNILSRSAPAATPPVDNALPPGATNPQTARVEGATTQNPGGNATVTLGPATVEQPATDRLPPDAARTLVQTQAIPPSDINRSSGAFVNDGTVPDYSIEARPSTQPGVGARNDDAPPVTGNSTKDIINATFATGTNQLIVPRANVLDDYASYTYQISWYLLTPQQYNNLIFSPKFNQTNWSLLMQSGGAPLPATSNTSQPTNLPGRSPFFPLDYYIDDLELFSKFPGKGVGMPHNVLDIKFKVNEPNGITLIDNLYAAVNSLYRKPQSLTDEADSLVNQSLSLTPNYLTAQYCLAVKFYGYDSGGNLIAPATGSNTTRSSSFVGPSNDPRAVIEKYYPFVITELKFRVQSRMVEYYIEGKPVSMNQAFGQSRGTIPFNFELSGTTVKDLLIGKPAQEGLKPLQDGRVPQTQPAKVGLAPAEIRTNTGAGVNENGNFDGSGATLGLGA